MPTFRITGPDGTVYRVTGPDGSTKEQALAQVQSRVGRPTAPQGPLSAGDVATQAIQNIPSSAAQFASDVAQPFIHPIDTATNIKNIGEGVLQKFGVVSGADKEKYADAVGKFFADRYGGWENIKKTIASDPVGVLADLSTVLGGIGAGARAPGVVGKVSKVAQTASRFTDPITLAGKAASPVVRATGKVAANALGVTTGAGGEAIKTAYQAGKAGGPGAQAFKEGLRGTDTAATAVNEAKAALAQLRSERGAAYRSGMASVRQQNRVLDFAKIDTAVQKVEGVKKFKGQDLSPSTLDVRAQIADEITKWKALDPADFHTAEGLDALKQKIGDIRDGTQPGTPARVIANEVYRGIRQTIVDEAPQYAKVMKGYEEASGIIKEIESTLSLNPRAAIDTQLRKLQSVLRDNVNTNYGRRAELVEFLKRAGAPHLIERLSGQALSSVAPRGINRAVASGEGIAALAALAHGNPAVAATLLGGLAGSSPALVGAGAYGLGAGGRIASPVVRPAGLTAFQLGRQ